MREIKFRAWNKNFEEMSVVADLDFWANDVWIIDPDVKNPNQMDRSEVVLMQYTGLKDINGVEIYEGDIVKIHKYNHIGKVYLNVNHGWVISGICMSVKVADKSNKIEVLGNIYQNPELLAKIEFQE